MVQVRKTKLRLTGREVLLAIIVGLMGFFLTLRSFLLFLNAMNPLVGFTIYQVIMFTILLALSRGDLVIFSVRIKSLTQTIGLWLITFALFITFSWCSSYVQYVCTGSFQGAANIFYNSQDGVTWWLWSLLIRPVSAFAIQVDYILTYVITPFALCLLGGYLAKGPARF